MNFSRKNKLKKIYSEKELKEIQKFHLMLLKMKKRRPNLQEIRLINLIYPNHNIPL